MRKLAYTKESILHGESHLLQCCLCGNNNRDDLLVEDIGIGIGMCGNNYSFCKKCWNSKNLGKKLLSFLGYPNRMKLQDACLDIKELE